MTTDEILKNATPRPWKHHDMESATIVANHIAVADFGAHSRPRVENEANCCFSILAVNTYEKQREVIRELVEALRIVRRHTCSTVNCGCGASILSTEIPVIESALAKAKELL